jgi:hypothetical protein
MQRLAAPQTVHTKIRRGAAKDKPGADLPKFIKDEFDACLACGILAQGFS